MESINFEAWLKPLVRAVVAEVLAECGQGQAPKLYSPDEAAVLLSVPKRWLYERTAAGTIPHQRLGKYIRFTDADLRAIIAQSSGR
jgi:excisionase family DNA binding protein